MTDRPPAAAVVQCDMNFLEMLMSYKRDIPHQTAREVVAELRALRLVAEAAEDSADALHHINQWCEAYPVEVFSQAGADRALEQMKAAGIDPSCLHASWSRHLLDGIGKIARGALRAAGRKP